MQECWRPSRLTGVQPGRLSGSLEHQSPAAQHRYVCYNSGGKKLPPRLPGCHPAKAAVPVCRSWWRFSWSERENLRPHSVTSHWYGFSPVRQINEEKTIQASNGNFVCDLQVPRHFTCVFAAVHLQMGQFEVFLTAARVGTHKRALFCGV